MEVFSAFKKQILFIVILFLCCPGIHAQPITGIWKGKMGNSSVELKLIRKGDSLIGTSYYYDSKSNYRRYSVKGYFDDLNNDVIWWDDILLENSIGAGQQPLLAVADFNCPGEGVMKLDGKSSRKQDEHKEKKELHLVKGNTAPKFPDEWDFLIENYAYGVAHPEIVDSIELIAFKPVPADAVASLPENTNQLPEYNQRPEKPVPAKQESISVLTISHPSQTNEERFTSRTKVLQQVIPLKGDSIEFRFYDNAEIDGDSIAVFLNGRLLEEHILLAEQAYTIRMAVADLQTDNELVMVAENLGSIPPNTSLMVAVVDDKRYEAHLQSTEGSSALVRLVKP